MKKYLLLVSAVIYHFIGMTQLTQNSPCNTHDLCILNANSNLQTGGGYWFHSINTVDGNFNLEMTSNKNLAYKLFGPFETVTQHICDSISQEISDLAIFYTNGQTILSLSDVSPIGSFYVLYVTNLANGNGAIVNVNTINCIPFVLGSIIEEFYGEKRDEATNVIFFNTSRENNVNYYELEYSNNGIEWQTLGKTYATNLTFNRYQVEHQFEYHENYYRLLTYDFDGTSSKSKEIIYILNRKQSHPIKIYNLIGQEVDTNYKGLVIYQYEDGSTVKRLN